MARLDTRLTLVSWLSLGDNIEKYRAWLNDPVTDSILELVERDCKPTPIGNVESAADLQVLGANAYAKLEGMQAILARLNHADAFVEVPTDEGVLSENERQTLKEMGYSDDDINRHMREIEKNG